MLNQPELSPQPMRQEMMIRLGALTDVGQLREHNEDNFLVCANLTAQNWYLVETPFALGRAGSLLALADGMGGENAGEVASALAMEAIKEFFSGEIAEKGVAGQAGELLIKAILFAHKKIVEYTRTHPECEGMGTTILLAWILNTEVYLAWSGDSRCYRYRNGNGLKILSSDHSVVWELVMAGKLDADEAENHPESHIITQSLGDTRHPPRPDVLVTSLQAGDKLLLCSDGLNGMLTSATIEQIVRRQHPLEDLCKELIDAANRNGGEDNITVVMLEVMAEPVPAGVRAPEMAATAEPASGVTSSRLKSPGETTAKTYHTARQPVASRGAFFTYRWLIGAGILLLLATAFWIDRQRKQRKSAETSQVAASQSRQRPYNQHQPLPAPVTKVTPADSVASGNKIYSRAEYTLASDTARRLVKEIRVILKRYEVVKEQMETLHANPGTAPIPNDAGLAEAITRLPAYQEIKGQRTDSQAIIALQANIHTQAECYRLEISLRGLQKQLQDLEKKLGNQTNP